MKKLYWRPSQVSRAELVLLALLSLGGLVAVESFKLRERQPFYREKIAAAHLAEAAFETVKAEHLRRKLPIDAELDPAQSGLVGSLISPITSNTGVLAAKQTSINPNFAAIIVGYLKRIGVAPGDVVAVGASGSFPALNIATYAALETLELRPLVISSAAASQWGANEPSFTWPDMEKVLFDRKLIHFRSIAVSRGGIEDRGLGLTKEGRKLLDDALARTELPILQVKSYADSVEQRMALYTEHAGEAPVRAYINVGGGTSSVGTRVGKGMFRPGLNTRLPLAAEDLDSVMTRFAGDGVPVVHLVKIRELAERFGLSVQPTSPPPVGQGSIFVRQRYNPYLAIGFIVAIIGARVAFIRMDLGFRILRGGARGRKAPGTPQQMV